MKNTRFLSMVFSAFLAISAALIFPIHASAALIIDTDVSIRPANISDLSRTNFTENLGPADERYLGGEHIIFRVKVTNSGPDLIREINITNNLPQYLDVHETKPLNWDSSQRTTKYYIEYLDPGFSIDYFIPMKIAPNDSLPGAPYSTFCNTVQTTATSMSGSANDSTSFCVEKRPPTNPSPTASQPEPTQRPAITTATTTPSPTSSPAQTMPQVTQTPNTGPGAGILLAGMQVAMLGIGIALKRQFAQ